MPDLNLPNIPEPQATAVRDAHQFYKDHVFLTIDSELAKIDAALLNPNLTQEQIDELNSARQTIQANRDQVANQPTENFFVKVAFKAFMKGLASEKFKGDFEKAKAASIASIKAQMQLDVQAELDKLNSL